MNISIYFNALNIKKINNNDEYTSDENFKLKQKQLNQINIYTKWYSNT